MKRYFLSFLLFVCIISNAHAQTHEGVDLGLPSGNIWARHSLGASSAEGFGEYCMFGSLIPLNHSFSEWSSSKSVSAEFYKQGLHNIEYGNYNEDIDSLKYSDRAEYIRDAIAYLELSNLSVSDSSDCDSTVACVDIQEDSDIDAKISFFKEYFNRYEVKESGDERYNSYTEDMRNNRIDIGCISAFSLAEEGTGIFDASLSVTHKEGDCFFVSYHGDNRTSHGNIPTAKWIVEIVSENGEYKINDINYYDVTPNKIAGRWMAVGGSQTTYIFNFNKDGSGDCYGIYIPSAYAQENGERTEVIDKKLFLWSASKQSISIYYNNGDKENICVDEEGPWWESAFEDKCHWIKFANL